MKEKKLRMTQQTKSGLNIQFVNLNSGRHVSREHVITKIEKGNPTYGDYHVVKNPNVLDYVRSNPDGKANNNIE